MLFVEKEVTELKSKYTDNIKKKLLPLLTLVKELFILE
mgnify:CR=1 FL=1